MNRGWRSCRNRLSSDLQALPKAANSGLSDTPLFAAFGSFYRKCLLAVRRFIINRDF